MVDDPTPGTRTTAAQFAALWVGLARAALDRRGDAERGTLATEPAVVARAIDEHQRVEAYDQVIVGYLLQIAEELRSARGAEAQELRRRTSMLVSAMQPETLRRLLDMGGDITQRGRFVTNAASGMAAGAVIDLLKAAAEASSETVSNGLVRLFTKLAVHADGGSTTTKPLADSALRDQVHSLLADWNLADPNPTEYRIMLQQMSKAAAPTPQTDGDVERGRCSSRCTCCRWRWNWTRTVPGLWRALDALVAADQVAGVIELLGQMPDCDVARSLWARMRTPVFVQRLLDEAPYDQGLDSLVPFLPTPALVPLFDLLLESEDRHVRRTTFDRLRRAGQAATPLILERLNDPRWYVIRNLLSLVAFLDPLPPGFDPAQWLEDADARVRREALRVALRVNRAAATRDWPGTGRSGPDDRRPRAERGPRVVPVRHRASPHRAGRPARTEGSTAGAVGESPRASRRRTRSPRAVAAHHRRRDVLLALAARCRRRRRRCWLRSLDWRATGPRDRRAARVIQRARKSTETAVQAAVTESQS